MLEEDKTREQLIAELDELRQRLAELERDITERKQAEEALRESQECFEFVLKGSRLGLWDWNLETNEVNRNERWAEMLGYKLQDIEFTVKQWLDFIHPDDRSMVNQSIQDHLEDRTPIHRVEYRMLAKDGQYRWILDQAQVVKWDSHRRPIRMSGTHSDITERKRAEEALREANEYLNNLFNYANAPIIVWDPEFRITRFNHAFEKLTGRTTGDVIGNNLEILFPPALVESSMQLIKKTLTGERWETVEVSIQHVDGAVCTVLWNSATIFATDGITPVATIAQGHDITERKRTREALREANEYLNNLINYANAPIIVWDPQFRITRFNHAFEKLTGRTAGDVIGNNLEILFPPALVESSMQLIKKTLLGERWETVELSILHIDGAVRTVLWNSATILATDGITPVATIAQGHDITERKRTREALREANEYLNNLINYANAPIIVWDPEFRITRFNHAFEKLTGRTAADVIGNNLEILFPPALVESSMQLIKKTLMGERWETVEITIQHVDGVVHTVLWNSATILATDGITPVAAIAQGQDITERMRGEAERIKLERQLQQARKAESLGRMAGAIAHHFNNKLMIVTGNLELALIHAGPNPELSTHLSEAQRATAQAAEVSNLMLAYLGQTLSKAEPFDLAKVCHEVIEAQRASIPKRVILKTDIPPHGPTIKANRAQARQILSNLIVNAWEAIAEGEGDIQVSLRVANIAETSSLHFFPADWRPEKDNYACVEVSDTGCGINFEQLDLIFDPFFSTKFAGRGLGLAVVLGTVRSFGGAIAVESEPGRGSIFRVLWPIAEQRTQPVQQTETEASRSITGSGLVLFVDDEAQLRNMAELMLGRLGFKVIKAGHGLEALELFRMRKDEISLVILDLTMPGMSGWETLEALRALRPDIPVVLASGYDEAKVMEGKRTELPQAFLHKPYSMADLKDALDGALK